MGRRDGLDERAYSFPPAYANAHGRHPHQRPALGAQGAQVPDASLRAAHASVGRPPRPSHRRAAPMEWSRSRASTTVRRAHRRRSDVAAGTGGSTPRPGLSARPGAAANRPGAQPSAAGPGRGPGVKPGEHQAGVSPRTGGAHPGMRPTRRPRRYGPRGGHHHLGAGRGKATHGQRRPNRHAAGILPRARVRRHGNAPAVYRDEPRRGPLPAGAQEEEIVPRTGRRQRSDARRPSRPRGGGPESCPVWRDRR